MVPGLEEGGRLIVDTMRGWRPVVTSEALLLWGRGKSPEAQGAKRVPRECGILTV